jgi:ArsR family transcriptional regulator
MPVPESTQQELTLLHAEVCSGLSDAKRILLLYALSDGERSVGELASELGMSQPAVSHHLAILRKHSMVAARRSGMQVYYDLADRRVIDALNILRVVLTDTLSRHQRLVVTETES